jgi:protein-S-isoprenylcysteine O-methyltransferase Ste14
MPIPVPSREARPAGPAWNLAKTLGQSAVFWATFLFLIPVAIIQGEDALGLARIQFASPTSRILGITLFVLLGSLGLTSGTVMAVRGLGTPLPLDCPRRLVVVGPYRHIRNPMAVAGLGQALGVGTFLGSPTVLAYVVAGGLVWNYFVRPGEEADLERRFGEPYRLYRRRVRCWWPNLRGYDPAAEADSSGQIPDSRM